jgi:DNA-binding MarR family transcriptional regulator
MTKKFRLLPQQRRITYIAFAYMLFAFSGALLPMSENKSTPLSLPLNPRLHLILLAFAERPAHGYEIMKRAAARSGGVIKLDAGSLYRSIAHLLDLDLIEEVERPPEAETDDARRRYYGLTDRGRELAAGEARRLAGLVEYASFSGLIDSPRAAE